MRKTRKPYRNSTAEKSPGGKGRKQGSRACAFNSLLVPRPLSPGREQLMESCQRVKRPEGGREIRGESYNEKLRKAEVHATVPGSRILESLTGCSSGLGARQLGTRQAPPCRPALSLGSGPARQLSAPPSSNDLPSSRSPTRPLTPPDATADATAHIAGWVVLNTYTSTEAATAGIPATQP